MDPEIYDFRNPKGVWQRLAVWVLFDAFGSNPKSTPCHHMPQSTCALAASLIGRTVFIVLVVGTVWLITDVIGGVREKDPAIGYALTCASLAVLYLIAVLAERPWAVRSARVVGYVTVSVIGSVVGFVGEAYRRVVPKREVEESAEDKIGVMRSIKTAFTDFIERRCTPIAIVTGESGVRFLRNQAWQRWCDEFDRNLRSRVEKAEYECELDFFIEGRLWAHPEYVKSLVAEFEKRGHTGSELSLRPPTTYDADYIRSRSATDETYPDGALVGVTDQIIRRYWSDVSQRFYIFVSDHQSVPRDGFLLALHPIGKPALWIPLPSVTPPVDISCLLQGEDHEHA